MDIATRYFLRRLAIARHRRSDADPSVPYSEAKVETIVVFVLMPMLALLSIAVVGCIRWLQLASAAHASLPSKLTVGVAASIISAIVGNMLFDRRFRRYLHDQKSCCEFDTPCDKRIAMWQKFSTIVICAIVVPWIAILAFYFTS